MAFDITFCSQNGEKNQVKQQVNSEVLDITLLMGQTGLSTGAIFQTEKKRFYLKLLAICLKPETKCKVHLFVEASDVLCSVTYFVAK